MRWSGVKLLVLDFDGVLTDNNVYVNEEGLEMVCCSRADGLGIEMIKKSGIDVLVLSKEKNKVVQARCKKLMIEALQGVDDKLAALKKEIKKRKLSGKNVCYVGNDINDYECMKWVGLRCAVGGAHPKILKIADFITKNTGGNGAVREICEAIEGGLR
jgi:YrbI family 3-deoxy-D-manno-octulosonate 8-phosphate phosphatase